MVSHACESVLRMKACEGFDEEEGSWSRGEPCAGDQGFTHPGLEPRGKVEVKEAGDGRVDVLGGLV